MPLSSILATVAAYIAIAVLLLSLNLTSRWRWWIKAAAIVVTGGFFIVSYFAIASLLGWPTEAQVPDRFLLVATRVVEPDAFLGTPGAVFLWLEELDENNVPNGRPRGYQLGYTDELAATVEEAQALMDDGEQVEGQVEEVEREPTEAELGAGPGEAAGAGNFETPQFNLTFDNLPAVRLPDKGVL